MLSTFYRSRSSFVTQPIPGDSAWINGRHRRNTGSYMHATRRHIAAWSTPGLLSCSPSDRLDMAFMMLVLSGRMFPDFLCAGALRGHRVACLQISRLLNRLLKLCVCCHDIASSDRDNTRVKRGKSCGPVYRVATFAQVQPLI